MAWYSDEAYDMISDSREKKSVAASAFKKRIHCGKGGSVKFPSDFLSKKELKNMSGECIKYASLKKPMTWEEFKELPNDLKKEYIKNLREKFNVPDKDIADMFDVHRTTFVNWMKCIGCSKGKDHNQIRTWNREGWLAWVHGVDETAVTPSETPVEEEKTEFVEPEIIIGEPAARVMLEETVNEDTAENIEALCQEVMHMIDDEFATKVDNAKPSEPTEKKTCSCEKKRAVPRDGEMNFKGNIDDILNTISLLLDGNTVNLTMSWYVIEE